MHVDPPLQVIAVSPDVGPSERSIERPAIFWICLIGLMVMFSYFVIYHWHHESKDNGGHLGDFRTFYQAAQFALEHRDIYTAGHNSSQMYVYPPLIAFLFTPLTALSELAAAHVYLVLSAMMLLGSALVGARSMLERLDRVPSRGIVVVAFLICVLSENEMRAQLTMLETDALMLLMFTLGLWWLDRRPILSGGALALALNVKYLSIVMLPYLIIRRRWKAAGAMAIGTVFFALLPALLLGWHENLRCLHVALGGLLRWVGVPPEVSHAIKVHNIADDLSVSITSMLGRVLGRRGFSNPLIMLIAAGVGAGALAIVQRMYRANGIRLMAGPPVRNLVTQPWRGLAALEWAGLITVALAFSPDTNTRHLVMAVLVNAAAAVLLLSRRPAVRRTPVVVAAITIFLGFIMLGHDLRPFYFRYSIPGWCLLTGYLLILWTGLRFILARADSHPFVVSAATDRRH